MVDYTDQLGKGCFPFLDKGEAEALLRTMTVVSHKAGTPLYKMNDPADCLYVLVAGKIAVQMPTGFGDRLQVVALLDAGAPVGESGLLDNQSRGATLAAVEDSCLLLLSRQDFANISVTHPVLAVKILKWLMARLSIRLKKNSERLAHVL
jgi:CRP-like cAMP-binding protein